MVHIRFHILGTQYGLLFGKNLELAIQPLGRTDELPAVLKNFYILYHANLW